MATDRAKTTSACILLGASVVNPQRQPVGEIDDFIVDLATGTVLYVVVNDGGSTHAPRHTYLLPWSSLSIDIHGTGVVFDAGRGPNSTGPANPAAPVQENLM